MRFLFAFLLLSACKEQAAPKNTSADASEMKMRATEPGETSITVRGLALGDGGGIEVVEQDYGESEVVTGYGTGSDAHLITVSSSGYLAVGGIFYAVRDEGEGWEVSTEVSPVGFPVEQIDGVDNGQNWRVIAPLGASIVVENW